MASVQSVQTDHAGNQFTPSRIIILSELSTREKEKYYQILLSNKAKFHRDPSGKYVANLRILAPGVKKEVEIKKAMNSGVSGGASVGGQSLPLEDRLNRLEQAFVTVNIVGVEPFDYSPYNRFSLLIATNRETVRPRPQSLPWLMKRIESLYDARFTHEKMDVERDDGISTNEPNSNLASVFPLFVVKRLSTEKGLIKTIVDQNCWDLLYNTHVYRQDYLEVEMFARFLQEFYDNDDLLFYLYVRSVIAKVLNISFRSRWGKSDTSSSSSANANASHASSRQPKGLWMSHRECVQVARIVFGVNNEVMWRRFLSIIAPQMVGQRSESSDSRRIDLTQFLHLAVVGYHQTQPQSQSQQQQQQQPSQQSSQPQSQAAIHPNSYPSATNNINNNNNNNNNTGFNNSAPQNSYSPYPSSSSFPPPRNDFNTTANVNINNDYFNHVDEQEERREVEEEERGEEGDDGVRWRQGEGSGEGEGLTAWQQLYGGGGGGVGGEGGGVTSSLPLQPHEYSSRCVFVCVCVCVSEARREVILCCVT